MSGKWQRWLDIWCLGIGLFGALLLTGALPAIDGPLMWFLALLGQTGPIEADRPLRFACAVLGAVSIGWAIIAFAAIRAALMLGDRGRPTWLWLTAGVLVWFVADSTLSVATGFALNVIPNLILLAMFLVPVLSSGVLRKP